MSLVVCKAEDVALLDSCDAAFAAARRLDPVVAADEALSDSMSSSASVYMSSVEYLGWDACALRDLLDDIIMLLSIWCWWRRQVVVK
jgi:hypothetical protein